MQKRVATGWRSLALLPLIAAAACTNPTPSPADNAAAGRAQVAGAEAANSTTSVNAVSDALGRRLDGMLSARQASR